jgi:hypothetical protein
MNAKSAFIVCLLASCVFFTIRCTKISAPAEVAGNSSQTPNALTGLFFKPDGETPASGVLVHLRLKSSLPVFFDSHGSGDTASVFTDESGRFRFTLPGDKGTYVIEASSGDNAVFIDSLAITRRIESITLPPDTLRPVGAIKGIIRLPGGGNPANAYVLVFGIDRYATVKSDGSFVFYPLAQGKYDLHFITTLEDYGVVDSNNVTVTSSDTTDLGTLELPFSGIPAPKNVTFSYDTMKQIVTLRWNRINSGRIKSFNIYRRDLDSLNEPIRIDTICLDSTCNKRSISSSSPAWNALNTRPVVDTFYMDSGCAQDRFYAYSIACVDTFESIGNKSGEKSVEAIGAFVPIDNAPFHGQTFADIDIALDNQNNLWVVDFTRNGVQKYNSSGGLEMQWEFSGYSTSDAYHPNIAVDEWNNIFLTGFISDSTPRVIRTIQKYDSSGHLIQSMNDSSGPGTNRICFDENGNIYNTTESSESLQFYINKFTPDLTPMESWKRRVNSSGRGIMAKNGKLYCSGSITNATADGIVGAVVEIFDTMGTKYNVLRFPLSGEDRIISILDIAMDKSGLLYCAGVRLDDGKFYLFDEKGDYIGKFEPRAGSKMIGEESNLNRIAVMDNGTIVVMESFINFNIRKETKEIYFFRKR